VRNSSIGILLKQVLPLKMFSSPGNVGGSESFTPICAFINCYALYDEVSINSDGTQNSIGTAAFEKHLTLATKTNWFNDTSGSPNFRHLAEKTCNQRAQQECCCADAFNGLTSAQLRKKKYCEKRNCSGVCSGKKKRVRRRQLGEGRVIENAPAVRHLRTSAAVQRIMINANLSGIEFNDALRNYTDLASNTTGAVPYEDATSVEDLAVCRAKNFNATEYDKLSLECGQYANSSCKNNDYIIVDSNETEINGTSAYCLPDDFHCADQSGDLCTIDTWYID
jgi:hypothetical protein